MAVEKQHARPPKGTPHTAWTPITAKHLFFPLCSTVRLDKLCDLRLKLDPRVLQSWSVAVLVKLASGLGAVCRRLPVNLCLWPSGSARSLKMISNPGTQSVCVLLLLMPLLPLQLLLRIPERHHDVHVVRLLLVVTGFLMTPEATMDVMVKAPALLVAVLIAAAPQDVRLVVVHSWGGENSHHMCSLNIFWTTPPPPKKKPTSTHGLCKSLWVCPTGRWRGNVWWGRVSVSSPVCSDSGAGNWPHSEAWWSQINERPSPQGAAHRTLTEANRLVSVAFAAHINV